MLRFSSIVQEERVRRYGKKKTKTLFIVSSILMSLLVVVGGFFENSEIDSIRAINRCNGIDHKFSLISTANLNPYYSLNLVNLNSEYVFDKLVEIIRKTAFNLKFS